MLYVAKMSYLLTNFHTVVLKLFLPYPVGIRKIEGFFYNLSLTSYMCVHWKWNHACSFFNVNMFLEFFFDQKWIQYRSELATRLFHFFFLMELCYVEATIRTAWISSQLLCQNAQFFSPYISIRPLGLFSSRSAFWWIFPQTDSFLWTFGWNKPSLDWHFRLFSMPVNV